MTDSASPSRRDEAATPIERCGMARAAELLGDRWTLLIVREALYGVTRFEAIRADLDIPRTVLSKRLRHLVDVGVLKKRSYREPGQRAREQYVLTTMGVELALPMIALMHWGEKHILRGEAGSAIVERGSDAPLHAGLVTNDGRPVGLANATFRPMTPKAAA